MENGQKCISDLFESRRIFQIPKYQRAYAWENKQLEDFIQDLDNQSVDKDYFLGTLLLQIGENDGHFKIVNIVDGQQRLTTLVIFLRFLLEKLQELGDDTAIPWESYICYRGQYKLRVLEYDQEFFRRYILENEEIKDNSLIETPSQKRLLNAKNFFIKQLEKRSLDDLRELQKKIENAKILTYAVVNNAEATLIFETHNDRGKPLTSLEKLKSFLMYQVYITASEPEKYLQKIQDIFGEIYRKYEEINKNQTIDEDIILRYHYITFEDPNSEDIYEYSEHLDLIKNKINTLTKDPNTFINATESIEEYSLRLMETFALFLKLFRQRRIPGNILNLFHLQRQRLFYPLLLVSIKYCDNNFSRVLKVAKLLEIMSFRVYGIRRRRTNNKKILKRLHNLAQTFRGDFEELFPKIKDLIGEFCSDHEFYKRLSSPNLYDDLKTNDLQYLLWQYENYLRIHEYSETTIRFNRFYRLSIEHILPQTPQPSMQYLSSCEQIHSLGNLVLDSSSENSAKSNRNFEQKYHYFYQKSSFYSQRELIKFYNYETEEWDNLSIQKRAEKIITFALNNWNHNNI